MTEYLYEGQLVDVKPTNLHGSMKVAPSTSLAAGLVVMDNGSNQLVLATDGVEGSSGVITQTIDNSASSTATDKPYTYTYFGWVRLVAKTAISQGVGIMCGEGGKVKPLGAGDPKLKIGRAMNAASAEDDIILALVYFG